MCLQVFYIGIVIGNKHCILKKILPKSYYTYPQKFSVAQKITL